MNAKEMFEKLGYELSFNIDGTVYQLKEKVGTEIHDMMYVIDVSDILELLEEIE